jgi:prepilin signal peptidase PulO-like enzyme (type II secretory pathway)
MNTLLTVVIVVLVLGGILYAMVPAFRDTLKGWKTMLLAAATAAVGFLDTFDIQQIIPPNQVGYWLVGIGVAFAVLRAITTTSVGKSN